MVILIPYFLIEEEKKKQKEPEQLPLLLELPEPMHLPKEDEKEAKEKIVIIQL